MDLLLIRHALPERVSVEHGVADPHLSDEGQAQAKELAVHLSDEPITRVFTSPRLRARQTAQAVGDALGLEPEVRDGLSEFDTGSTEYIPLEEMKASGDPRWQEIVDGTWVPEDGRSHEDFLDTVIQTVETIIDECASARVAVSCHGRVINAYLSHILGLSDSLFFEPRYASISRVVASSQGHRTLVSLNEVGHLSGVRH